MPTYVYRCESCKKEFDHWQTMASGKLRKCKLCKSFGLKRLIGSGSAPIFKGEGFYANDYAKNNGLYDIDRQRENVREHEIRRGE